jgi:hypothetical protein
MDFPRSGGLSCSTRKAALTPGHSSKAVPRKHEPTRTECQSSGRMGVEKGGTEGSNPSPPAESHVSLPHPLSKVENPGLPRGCARLAWRQGRQRRAGCFDIAPTGGNISVGRYFSTAVPLRGSARRLRWFPTKSGLLRASRAVDLQILIGLRQSRAWSADRASQAADGSARGASLPSNRVVAAHRGSPG